MPTALGMYLERSSALAPNPPDARIIFRAVRRVSRVFIPTTDPQASFNTLKDFSYISTITLFPFALFVAANAPYKTLKDFIAAARERPGKMNYGHAGTGNTLHLAVELLKSRTGIQIEPVAYKDQAQLISDVIAGRLDASISTFTNFHSALSAGQARRRSVARADDQAPGALFLARWSEPGSRPVQSCGR